MMANADTKSGLSCRPGSMDIPDSRSSAYAMSPDGVRVPSEPNV